MAPAIPGSSHAPRCLLDLLLFFFFKNDSGAHAALMGFCTVIFNQSRKPGFRANDCFLKQQEELRGKQNLRMRSSAPPVHISPTRT